MAYKTLLVENTDNICSITLNRPKALNALSSTLISELTTSLIQADNDKNVRVIIITGSEKVFAAGADIKEMSEKNYVEMVMTDFFGVEHNIIMKIRKPIIAAVKYDTFNEQENFGQLAFFREHFPTNSKFPSAKY